MRIFYLLFLVVILNSCSSLKEAFDGQLPTRLENTKREIIIVYVRADWSDLARRVDAHIDAADSYFITKDDIRYIKFDLTNRETAAQSFRRAKIHGLGERFQYEKNPGEVLFFDRETKKLLTRVYGIEDAQKYREIARLLMLGKDVEDIVPAKNLNKKLPPLKLLNSSEARLYIIYVHNERFAGANDLVEIYKKLEKKYGRKKDVYFARFDTTSPESIFYSERVAQALGVTSIFKVNKRVGDFLFVNAKTKQIMARLYNEKDKDSYYKLIKKMRKQAKNS
jgi:hypothetical protein